MSEVSNCVFCKIYKGIEPATILYKDDSVAIFNDIHPAAKHHYLIVTKDHIENAKVLTKDHISVLENLISHGKRIIEEKQGDTEDTR